MPTLNWIGKDAVVEHHRRVPTRLLECDRVVVGILVKLSLLVAEWNAIPSEFESLDIRDKAEKVFVRVADRLSILS
jgi:hypothetical protein